MLDSNYVLEVTTNTYTFTRKEKYYKTYLFLTFCLRNIALLLRIERKDHGMESFVCKMKTMLTYMTMLSYNRYINSENINFYMLHSIHA